MKLTIIHAITNVLDRLNRKRVILDRDKKSPYLERFYLLFGNSSGDLKRPKWFPFNLMLHRIHQSDPEGLHDHPWRNITLVLHGGYWEETPDRCIWRSPGTLVFRRAKTLHRIRLDPLVPEVWSLFLIGYRVREWGFLDSQGNWVQWKEYLDRK